jgi:aquaporin Z
MKQYGAEFLGTFWLVLGGCGSAVLAAAFPSVGIGLPRSLVQCSAQ